MFEYDKSKKILKIEQIKAPRLETEILPDDAPVTTKYRDQEDLLIDNKLSYETYLNQTIKEDIEDFCEYLQDSLGYQDVHAENIKVGKLVSTVPASEIKSRGNKYYPVTFDLYADNFVNKNIPFLNIPFMNDFCVLNVEGSEKVVLGELRTYEDISYDEKKSSLSCMFPTNKIELIKHSKGIDFVMGKKRKVSADLVVDALFRKEEISVELTDIYSNSIIRQMLEKNEGMTSDTIDSLVNGNGMEILDRLASKRYKLGKLRQSLNSRLTLAASIGKTLSRAVDLPIDGISIKEGTVITEAILRVLLRNRINCIYVKAMPRISGMYLTKCVNIHKLYKGMKLTPLLRRYLPEDYSILNYLTEDTLANITFMDGTIITEEMVKIMYDAGVREVYCATTKTDSPEIPMLFEQEFLGNYTARIADLFEDPPRHLNGEDYTCFYGVSDLSQITEPVNSDRLTVHDVAALLSLMGRIQVMPELNEAYNRDREFLKCVNLINETFSASLRKVIPTAINMRRNAIKKSIADGTLARNNDLWYGLYKEWLKEMRDVKPLMRPADSTNPISLLAQAKNIVTVVSKKSASDDMRALNMAYFGRICPYETPEGKGLGLVNTIATGCKIDRTILKTPFYRVIESGGRGGRRYRLSKEVEWLTLSDQLNYCVGDLLSLTFDKDGYIVNTKVNAMVPSGDLENNEERITPDVVNSHDLNYVNAMPEQDLSATASLVPFAAADDGVRVSFALKMIKQSIYIEGSEPPRVGTTMYKRIFDYSDKFLCKAQESGVVEDIGIDKLIVKYDSKEEETPIHISETNVSNKSITFMDYKVKPGDRFNKGDILADKGVSRNGVFSPGANVLVAYIPYDGYNYEDAIAMTKKARQKFTSITVDSVEKKFKRVNGEKHSGGRENFYKYIPRDGVIASIRTIDNHDLRRVKTEYMLAKKAAGILYDLNMEPGDDNSTTVKASLLAFNTLEEGDKLSGRHGNKGVTAKVMENSKAPMFKNGTLIDVCLNPLGVPSRMNIGQALEANLGFVGYLLDIEIQSDSFNGAKTEEISFLMKFIHALANRDDIDNIFKEFPGLPKGIYERARERHSILRDWEGCFDPDGRALLYNQITGKPFENPVLFGVSYFLKLEHEVDDKMHARGGAANSEYTLIDKQPTKGSSKGGGQKHGEMELSAFLAHGATEYIRECWNEKSDNVELRSDLIRDMQKQPRDYVNVVTSPRSVDLFRYELEIAGVKVDSDVLPSLDYDDIKRRKIFDPRVIANVDSHTIRKNKKIDNEDLTQMLLDFEEEDV